jgi:undecaprenyl diphosphate synthase
LDETSGNTGLTLLLALSYSSRWEITEAVKQIALKVKKGDLNIDRIDENLVADYLNTKNIPDPDLLIRTGGEYRISNFLMWQLSYAELYFTDVYWPEFREENLYKAILNFQNRERRFGKTGEQVQSEIIKQYK